MNYFLHTNNAEVLTALNKLTIEHPSMEIDGKKGLVIDHPKGKDKVRTFLGEFLKNFDTLKNVKIEWIGQTRYEGIDELYITSGKHKRVTIKNWDGYNETKFKEITESILGPIVKDPINIYVPHGRKEAPKKRGFNILFWSSPNGLKKQLCPSSMWGYKVDCRDEVFLPEYLGIVIYDGLYPVAELVDGNNLYIHHDLCHHGTNNELEIYRKILIEVIKEIDLSPEDREERRIQKLGKNKELYVDLCLNRIKQELKNADSTLTKLTKDIEVYKTKMIEALRKIEELKLLSINYEAALEAKKESYEIEFDKLLELDKVIHVDVSTKSIEVFTDTLYCRDPRNSKLYEIGKFRISIPIGTGIIKWCNLTRRVTGYSDSMHAPHIFREGKACLGNAEQVLPGLISSYQFSIIAMYAIQFVESVNIDDPAGREITAWPLAKKSKSKEK